LNGESGGALIGLTPEQWHARRPALTPENGLVTEIWAFCGGWNPALISDAAAYYGIDDIEWLTDQLLALRDCVRAHQAAVERAKARHD
jgi:hypothetical protein